MGFRLQSSHRLRVDLPLARKIVTAFEPAGTIGNAGKQSSCSHLSSRSCCTRRFTAGYLRIDVRELVSVSSELRGRKRASDACVFARFSSFAAPLLHSSKARLLTIAPVCVSDSMEGADIQISCELLHVRQGNRRASSQKVGGQTPHAAEWCSA